MHDLDGENGVGYCSWHVSDWFMIGRVKSSILTLKFEPLPYYFQLKKGTIRSVLQDLDIKNLRSMRR